MVRLDALFVRACQGVSDIVACVSGADALTAWAARLPRQAADFEDRCADLPILVVYGWYASSIELVVRLDALFVRA